MNQTLLQTQSSSSCFQEALPQSCAQPNAIPQPHGLLSLRVLFPVRAQNNKAENSRSGEGGRNCVQLFFISINLHALPSSLIPDLPCPPAAWVWVLTSWSSRGPTAPWSPPGVSGGRVTSSDAESTSFFRAVLISLSARRREAWTEVSSSDCGDGFPTDKKNCISLFGAKRKQWQHATHCSQMEHLSSRPSPSPRAHNKETGTQTLTDTSHQDKDTPRLWKEGFVSWLNPTLSGWADILPLGSVEQSQW